jgi:hypothetical protein
MVGYRIRTYPTSVFTTTCGTRVATKRPQWKPLEQLLDMGLDMSKLEKRPRSWLALNRNVGKMQQKISIWPAWCPDCAVGALPKNGNWEQRRPHIAWFFPAC